VARAIRQAIHDDAGGWAKATKQRGFTDIWSTTQDDDEMLKRVPSGLDPGHPFADDLRMKSFIAGATLTQKQVTSSGFDQALASMYSKASGFARFLCRAQELPF